MTTSDSQPHREWLILLTLAAIQFTNILDFVILMPLGPQLMRIFNISAQQFGLVVSAYTFSAGITGLLGAFFIDRFDRRTALLAMYAGFSIGTFMCAIAPSYHFLLGARVVAGAFGGVLGAMIFAVIGDVIPYQRRGAATGVVMTSFSVASVAGVPLGLYLANLSNWHAPFFVLAGSSVLMNAASWRILPVMRSHIGEHSSESPLHVVKEFLSTPKYFRAILFTSFIIFGGFSVIPYIGPYLVSNAKLPEQQLPLVYFFGGGATIFTARWIGRLADRYGKNTVFGYIALGSVIPIVALTNLPPVNLAAILVVTTLFMVLVSGRMIPAMAIVTSVVEPKRRGSFMSMNSSVQQLASGVASSGAGILLGTTANGSLTNYGLVGGISVVVTILCFALSRNLDAVEEVETTFVEPIH